MTDSGVEIIFVNTVFEVYWRVQQANNKKQFQALVKGHEKEGQAENVL